MLHGKIGNPLDSLELDPCSRANFLPELRDLLLVRRNAPHQLVFLFSSRRRHTISLRDWSSDVCSSDLDVGRCRLLLLMAAPSWAGGTASLTWSPATVGGNNYGKLEAGHTKSETFKLTNSGGQASAVLTITLSGSAAFSITSNGCLGRSL